MAPDFVRGDASGLHIPAHAAALREGGPRFLTEAFHQFGTLSKSNQVTHVTRLEPFTGGNSGQKVLLSVQYAQPEAGLHGDLFVKFSRDFADKFRDRRRHELESEVSLALLSRTPGFPVEVPTAFFADSHRESGTGLLISQRIAFGTGNIEPLRPKCMDHELADPLAYYRALLSSLARLAAAHKSGRLAQVDEYFPFDPVAAAAADPIPSDETALLERIARYELFVAQCPQLMPAHLATPAFIDRLRRDSLRILQHETMIKRFMQSERSFIALCHYNANIDNAWFWRDADGELQCGLLDWGRVRQMNVAFSLWGCLCSASLAVWDEHLDDLLEWFVTALERLGGPQLDISELKLHMQFYAATMGLAVLIDAPTLLMERLPEAAAADGTLDPVFHKNEMVRSFLHVFTVCLNFWHRQDLGAGLDELLSRKPHW